MKKYTAILSVVAAISVCQFTQINANCQLDQLPSELSTLITNNPQENFAWQGRDTEDECDLRNYGRNHKVFRYWSWTEEDSLNQSAWHKYCTARENPDSNTFHWKHVAGWDAAEC